MSATARVTAVVVNYNAGALLIECVRSLLAADPVAGVVVVDNHSSDGSVDGLRAACAGDLRLELIVNASNRGYAVAVNQGLARVESAFALVINPDCAVGRTMVADLVQAAEEDPPAAVCGGIVLDPDGGIQRATRRMYPSPARALRRALWLRPGTGGGGRQDFDRSHDPLPATAQPVDAVSGALMLVRMSAVESVGGMDEGYFLHCEDLDWCVRFVRAGWPVRFAPVGFAVHVQGVSGRGRAVRVQWHLHRGMARFYRRFEAEEHGAVFNAIVLAGIWIRYAALVAAGRLTRDSIAPSASGDLDAMTALHQRIERFESPRTLLVGASSAVAGSLLRGRERLGGWVLAVSRSADPVRLEDGVLWMRADGQARLPEWATRRLRRVIHVAPLWTLPAFLEHLAEVPIERVVACSSTSVSSKRESADSAERALAARLAEAEERVREICRNRGIELVLFRPTLIYAPGRDRSVERIVRTVRRFGVFPIAGRGRGLRQPVHADDVAEALLAGLERPSAVGRCYTLSGGETLSYRDMVARVFRALGRRPRIVSIPVPLYRALLALFAWLPLARGLSPRAADRMEQDLCFDHDDAARDLDFRPRPFLESS